MRWLFLLLLPMTVMSQPLTFTWDNPEIRPPGTTTELLINGQTYSGYTGNTATIDVPTVPGQNINAKARAIPPSGLLCLLNSNQDITLCHDPYQVSTAECPLTLCQPSVYSNQFSITNPADPTNVYATKTWINANNPPSIESTSFLSGINKTSLTWNHTVTNAKTLIFTIAAGGPNRTVSSVKYNGINATKIAIKDDGQWERVELWKMDNPAIGTHPVIITYSGSVYQVGAGVTGINGTFTLGTVISATGTTANPSATISNIAIGIIASDLGSDGTTTENGTLLWEAEDVDNDSDFNAQWSSSTSLGWTSNAVNGSWVYLILPIIGQ